MMDLRWRQLAVVDIRPSSWLLSHMLTTLGLLVRMEVASSRPDHLPTLSMAKASELNLLVKSLLVAERPMPALLLRLLPQSAGNIEMKPGPVSTPTPTNCLRLMQWNANGINGKITELLTLPTETMSTLPLSKKPSWPTSLKRQDGQLCDLTPTRTKAAVC